MVHFPGVLQREPPPMLSKAHSSPALAQDCAYYDLITIGLSFNCSLNMANPENNVSWDVLNVSACSGANAILANYFIKKRAT